MPMLLNQGELHFKTKIAPLILKDEGAFFRCFNRGNEGIGITEELSCSNNYRVLLHSAFKSEKQNLNAIVTKCTLQG